MEFVNLLLPIFAIILTGFIAAHFKLLPESIGDVLVQFAYLIGLPALLFSVIAQEPADRLFNLGFLASYGGGNLLIFGLVILGAMAWRKASMGDAAILGLIAACSNTGFVALPVLKVTLGHEGVLPAAIACVIMVTMILLAVVLIERKPAGDQAGPPSIWPSVRQALLNPLVLGTFLGIAYAVTGWPLPGVALDYLTLLGDSVTPCALFAVGMSIRLKGLKTGAIAILFLSTVKLVVVPAFVLLLAWTFELDPFFAVGAVVCSAVPTAKTVFVLAGRYNHLRELAAESVSTTALVSMLTLFVWLFVLSQIYPSAFSTG